MSYLDKLKAKAAPNPFVSFGRMSDGHAAVPLDPSVSFVGNEGIGVCENQPSPRPVHAPSFLERLQTRSQSEVFRPGAARPGLDAIPKIYPPQAPTKPTKVLIDIHEPQADPSRCHVCGEREEPHRPFVAVFTTKADERHWLHHGECHVEHSRRCAVRRSG